MREYIELDHMRSVTDEHLITCNYYILHKLVKKSASTTTKYRVVFNASFHSFGYRSLNDVLMHGPCIQAELFDIVIRFRKYSIAFVADIKQMYHQIRVHEDDAKYQQIFWKNSQSSEIDVYQLQTVTYGTKPASFLLLNMPRQTSRAN